MLIYLAINYLLFDYLFIELFSYLFIYLLIFFIYNLITYMCGLLMHDCRCPDAPPSQHTTAIGFNGKGEGGVDGLTL